MNLNLNEFKCLLPINYVEMFQIEAINGKVSQKNQSKLGSALLWHVTEIISEVPHRQTFMEISKINTVKKPVGFSHHLSNSLLFLSLKKILIKLNVLQQW